MTSKRRSLINLLSLSYLSKSKTFNAVKIKLFENNSSRMEILFSWKHEN